MVALNPQCWWGQLKLEQNKLVSFRLKILSASGCERLQPRWRGSDTYMYQPHTVQSHDL